MRVLAADVVAEHLDEHAAQRGRDLLGLLRRRRLAGADGPDRLVRDHDVGRRLDLREGGAQLGDRDGARRRASSRSSAVSPTQMIGDEVVRERRGDLARDLLVRLAVQRAALGVADDHVAALELRRGTPPRSRRCRRRTRAPRRPGRRTRCGSLSAETSVCTLRRSVNGGKTATSTRGEVVTGVFQAPGELLDERDRLQVVEVHLPVAGDERRAPRRRAHCCHPRTSSPGRCLPSRNSRLAPPPVEM